jgi:hypothetical protein
MYRPMILNQLNEKLCHVSFIVLIYYEAGQQNIKPLIVNSKVLLRGCNNTRL